MHATPAPARPGDVYFFGTCLLDLFLPEAGLDAMTLLEREGVRVHFFRINTTMFTPYFQML